MLSEVIATSAIEGENLDRDSVRSSLLRHFGEVVSGHRHDDRAAGAAELIVDVRGNWHRPLSHEVLGHWQSLVVVDRITSTTMRGAYRNDPEPMQIVSGRYIGQPRTVHYEAPPAAAVPAEMERFLDWYNDRGSNLPGPVRATVAHVWFEKIHPFDDGNGRGGGGGGVRSRIMHCHSLSVDRRSRVWRPRSMRIGTATTRRSKQSAGGDLDLGRIPRLLHGRHRPRTGDRFGRSGFRPGQDTVLRSLRRPVERASAQGDRPRSRPRAGWIRRRAVREKLRLHRQVFTGDRHPGSRRATRHGRIDFARAGSWSPLRGFVPRTMTHGSMTFGHTRFPSDALLARRPGLPQAV